MIKISQLLFSLYYLTVAEVEQKFNLGMVALFKARSTKNNSTSMQ